MKKRLFQKAFLEVSEATDEHLQENLEDLIIQPEYLVEWDLKIRILKFALGFSILTKLRL